MLSGLPVVTRSMLTPKAVTGTEREPPSARSSMAPAKVIVCPHTCLFWKAKSSPRRVFSQCLQSLCPETLRGWLMQRCLQECTIVTDSPIEFE